MMVHKNAAMKVKKPVTRAFPVSSVTVHEWLKEYLGNPNVEWINGTTLIVWNSPAHRKLMSR